MRNLFYEKIKNILDKKSVVVLESLVDLLENPNLKIIWIENIIEKVRERENINAETIVQIVDQLVKENYLKFGVSLRI